MRVRWLEPALADREAIVRYIAEDNFSAAFEVDELIANHVDMLVQFPEMGRVGRVTGTRELVISRTSYIVAYKIEADIALILRVLHGAQRWPKRFSRRRF